jgi:diguanylate cyclase (GGDEF)-like protein
VLAVGADGVAHLARYAPDDIETSRRGGYIRVPLPASASPLRHVAIAFDRPTHRMAVEQAQLVPQGAHDRMLGRRLLLGLAALCGMLLMPLMFNAAFYRVLRERFVVWHSALAITLMLSIVVGSGLSFYLGAVPVMTLNAANTLLFGFSVAAAGMFAHSFIERDMLHPRLRRALPLAAAWALLASGLHALFPFALRSVQSALYYWAYIPVLVVYVWMLVDALGRGSVAARYQTIGWAPMMGVGIIRLVSGLLPSVPSADAMPMFYIGCAVEVMATTLGVAERFMALKEQRDRARLEAKVFGELSERDPLTGLMNRRAVQSRFEQLHAAGYETVAVLDLDRFKAVNDRFGHNIGDDVLRACAKALKNHPGVLAIRLGGEEFMLLLQSQDGPARAEALRQGLTIHIAREVEALDQLVTASMGVVQIPRNVMPQARFDEIYERADKLLYEAKAAGRNRSMSERLRLFVPRRNERRSERRKTAA